MKKIGSLKIQILFGSLLLAAAPGCVGVGGDPSGPVYVQVPAVSDDYIYYPDYQVYYSSTRHQYIYRDGKSWQTRPAPAGVPVAVLSASPSVKLDFHDHPALHHAAVVQKYPGNESASVRAAKADGNGRN